MAAYPELTLADIKTIVERSDPKKCPHCGLAVAFVVRDDKPSLGCTCGYWCWLVLEDRRGGQQQRLDG